MRQKMPEKGRISGLSQVYSLLRARRAIQHDPRDNDRINASLAGRKDARVNFRSKIRGTHTGKARAEFPVVGLLLCVLLVLSGCGFHQGQAARASTSTPDVQRGFNTVPGAFMDLHMINATVGWAVSQDVAGDGNDTILRTSDGGAHWKATLTCAPTRGESHGSIEPCETDFRSATLATVVQPEYNTQKQASQLRIFHTADAGVTWQSSVLVAADLQTPATFVDAEHGWALVTEHFPGPDPGSAYIGKDISLYRTSDGGQNWQRVASGPATSQVSVTTDDGYGRTPLTANAHMMFSSPTAGWLVGQTYQNDGTSQGWVYVTHDGGATWHQSSPTLSANEYAPNPPVFFTSRDGVLLVSDSNQSTPTSTLYVTHDGGVTWNGTAVPFDITNGTSLDLQHAWSLPTLSPGTTLYTTSDGWQHATKVQMNMVFEHMYDLSFISLTTGWAFGDNLMGALHMGQGLSKGDVIALLKTTNDGQSWYEIAHSLV